MNNIPVSERLAQILEKSPHVRSEQVINELMELARAGNPEIYAEIGAIYERGGIVPRDYKKALEMYEAGLARGDSDLCPVELARVYYHGVCGVERDIERVYLTLRSSTDKSYNPMVWVGLGMLLLYGHGCRQDIEEAKYWLWRAWEAGNAIALGQYAHALHLQGKWIQAAVLRFVALLVALPRILFDKKHPNVLAPF